MRERFSDDAVEIQLRRLETQLVTQCVHAVDQIVDPAGRTPDSAECVLSESRIVKVCRQILQHEAQS